MNKTQIEILVCRDGLLDEEYLEEIERLRRAEAWHEAGQQLMSLMGRGAAVGAQQLGRGVLYVFNELTEAAKNDPRF